MLHGPIGAAVKHISLILQCPPAFLLPAFTFLLPPPPPPIISAPLDCCQLLSEPAFGFVLFDYITGNLEGQADKTQQL